MGELGIMIQGLFKGNPQKFSIFKSTSRETFSRILPSLVLICQFYQKLMGSWNPLLKISVFLGTQELMLTRLGMVKSKKAYRHIFQLAFLRLRAVFYKSLWLFKYAKKIFDLQKGFTHKHMKGSLAVLAYFMEKPQNNHKVLTLVI